MNPRRWSNETRFLVAWLAFLAVFTVAGSLALPAFVQHRVSQDAALSEMED